MKERKVLNLFTHTDLDGVGCSVLAHLYAKGRFDSISVKYCDYNNINQEVNHLLDYLAIADTQALSPVGERCILITDISIDYPSACRLDAYQRKHESTVVHMIDHHQVKDEIKAFAWVHVDTTIDQCGTSLLFDFLRPRMDYLRDHTSVTSFVEDVCLYDTWRFDKGSETNSENLNILLGLVGADEFEFMVTTWIYSQPDVAFTVSELDAYPFVEYDRKRRKEYCALRNHTMQKINYKGYVVGVAFAEQYISSVGDYILQNNHDIDFCAIVNLPKVVSLRTRREDINMGIDIARPLGGGGHPKAAGYQLDNLPEDLIKQIIKMV